MSGYSNHITFCSLEEWYLLKIIIRSKMESSDQRWNHIRSSDQRWNMPALHGLVLLLPHCHSWMLSKGVLPGSLTFLRMTSSLTKFSHWEPEEKLEPSHCSTVCIMERPRNCFVSCFLNIFSWIPVLDALLDRMTQLSKYLVPTQSATRDLLFHQQPASGILYLNTFHLQRRGPALKRR